MQGHGVYGAAQPRCKRNNVDLTALVQLLHKPYALLRGRQGVGCPPLYTRNNSLWRYQARNAGRKCTRAGVTHNILYPHRHREALA